MSNTLTNTNFCFPNQKTIYKGKVRDLYAINDQLLVMIATDRISAFDVILPKGIQYKGQILNQIATQMLQNTQDIVPNWLLATPDPNVAIGWRCTPFKVEMVIRGYLAGHAARLYKKGKQSICGISLPKGMKENDAFAQPIITPSTKADKDQHDQDISKEEILSKKIVSEQDYTVLENYTKKLFERGTKIAEKQGLILVDSKYEFGKTKSGKIVLIDEIHTPDSSRYFYKKGYQERQAKNQPQKQLSKEFVRQWLIQNNFQGKKGQQIPQLNNAFLESVSERYIELYENITGRNFVKKPCNDIAKRIETNVLAYLNKSQRLLD